MFHEISEQDWENYLSDGATGDARRRIEAHLIACPECRVMIERMRQAEGQFKRAISDARRQIALGDEQVYQGLRGVFLRLVAEESETEAGQQRIQQQIREQWLRALETALADLCGKHTAVRALRVAAENSPARSLERVEAGNWQPFLERLTSITQVLCGEIGAQLVGEIGRFPLNLSTL